MPFKTKLASLGRLNVVTANFLELFYRAAKIEDVRDFGPAYRLFTLRPPPSKWKLGQSINIRTDRNCFHNFMAFNLSKAGTFDFLAPSRDEIAFRWAKSVQRGHTVKVFGPLGKTRMDWEQNQILIADESHIAYAKLLSESREHNNPHFIFVADYIPESRELMEYLEMPHHPLVPLLGRTPDDKTLISEIGTLIAAKRFPAVVITKTVSPETLASEVELQNAR